jgi:hypothetical protein
MAKVLLIAEHDGKTLRTRARRNASRVRRNSPAQT